MKLRVSYRVKNNYRLRGMKRRAKTAMNFLERNEQIKTVVCAAMDLFAVTNPKARILVNAYKISRKMYDEASGYPRRPSKSKKGHGRKKRKR